MDNQHVIEYHATRMRAYDAQLAKFRLPGGNIAAPVRVMAKYHSQTMMYESIAQTTQMPGQICRPVQPN